MTRPLLLAWADGGPGVGLGHVVRTSALAQAWNDAGGVAVVCTSTNDPVVEGVLAAAEVVHEQIDPADEPRDPAGAAGFGRRAARRGAAWVSIDGYGLDVAVDRIVKDAGVRTLRIDDHVAGRHYDADLIVDQNLGAEAKGPALGRGETLAGTGFVLLRRAFRTRPLRSPFEQRLLVLLGGSPSDATIAYAGAVIDRLKSGVTVDVVSSRPLPTRRALTQHDWLPDIRPLYEQATLALSAAGSTVWELCATGVVPVVFAAANNQEPIGDALREMGAAHYVGPLCRADPDSAATVLDELVADATKRDTTRTAGAGIVDGLGAARVVARMRADLLSLRPVTRSDATVLFDWANDASVRAMSFSTAPIGWDEHVRWLDARLARADARTYIASDEQGNEVGMVRFDEIEPETMEIGVSIAAGHRGRRLAAPLVVAGCRKMARESATRVVLARIRPENTASIRAFATAGFDHVSRDSADGYGVESWTWVKPW